jgi:hypothetical protein
MEGVIKSAILTFFGPSSPIFSRQFAFLPGKSTTTQLLEYSECLIANVASQRQVDAVYFDFAKAFDSVTFPKLLHKLKFLGISDNLILWFESFLTERSQCVKVGNGYSDWAPVVSGIPQGSVIGPILFIIFIHDIQFDLNLPLNSLFIYADDLKCISVINSLQDCVSFQKELNGVMTWSTNWQLSLALNKCNVISFYLNNQPILFTYSLQGTMLQRVDHIPDLGVDFSYNLSFTNHISRICQNARVRAAQILKTFCSRDPRLLFRAFKTYVIPLLENSSNVWNPFRLSDIRKIEAIQRRFTKSLVGLKSLPYSDRLSALNAQSLEARREINDLTMYFKILHNCVDLPLPSFFCLRTGFTRRANSLNLVRPSFMLNLDRYCFSQRFINLWNLLPDSVVNASSISSFKSNLHSLDLDAISCKANSYNS